MTALVVIAQAVAFAALIEGLRFRFGEPRDLLPIATRLLAAATYSYSDYVLQRPLFSQQGVGCAVTGRRWNSH